jgi:hypothetical protein
MIRFREHSGLTFVVVLAITVLTAAPAWPQETPDTQSPSKENPDVQLQKESPQPAVNEPALAGLSADASSSDASASNPLPEGERFRLLGGGQLLGMQPGAIRLGPVYLSSVDLMGAYENFDGSGGKNIIRAGILSTNIVFDKQFGAHNRLALQYHPQLFVVNGDFQYDFLGHSANLSGFYTLSPRWTMNIYDTYAYLSNIQQRLQTLTGLGFDTSTGYTASNRFLLSPGNFVTNSSGMSLGYKAGERTTITLSPIINYAYTNSPGGLSGLQYGGVVGISHQLSESRTAMASYSAQKTDYSQQFSSAWYHTISVGLSQAFGRTAFITVTGQANTIVESGSTHWTGGGSLSFTKTFGKTALAASYMRSNQFLSTLNNGFGDFVQVTLSRQFTQKFQGTIGGGMYNGLWAPKGNKSYYGSATLSYQLLSNLFGVASYALRKQSGDSSVLLIGTENVATVGLQWIPGGRPTVP